MPPAAVASVLIIPTVASPSTSILAIYLTRRSYIIHSSIPSSVLSFDCEDQARIYSIHGGLCADKINGLQVTFLFGGSNVAEIIYKPDYDGIGPINFTSDYVATIIRISRRFSRNMFCPDRNHVLYNDTNNNNNNVDDDAVRLKTGRVKAFSCRQTYTVVNRN